MGLYARAKNYTVTVTYKQGGTVKSTSATVGADSEADAVLGLQAEVMGRAHSYTITGKTTTVGATLDPVDLQQVK